MFKTAPRVPVCYRLSRLKAQRPRGGGKAHAGSEALPAPWRLTPLLGFGREPVDIVEPIGFASGSVVTSRAASYWVGVRQAEP